MFTISQVSKVTSHRRYFSQNRWGSYSKKDFIIIPAGTSSYYLGETINYQQTGYGITERGEESYYSIH